MRHRCVFTGMSPLIYRLLTCATTLFTRLICAKTGLSCIHVLRVPGSSMYQVSWCAPHSQCLCFSTHSYWCRCSSARVPRASSRSCSAMIFRPMRPDISRSSTTLETNTSHCRSRDHACQVDHRSASACMLFLVLSATGKSHAAHSFLTN